MKILDCERIDSYEERSVYYNSAHQQTILYTINRNPVTESVIYSIDIGAGPVTSRPPEQIKAYYDLDNFEFGFECIVADNELCIDKYDGYEKNAGSGKRELYVTNLIETLSHLHANHPVFDMVFLTKSLADLKFLKKLDHPLLQDYCEIIPSTTPATFQGAHELLVGIFNN